MVFEANQTNKSTKKKEEDEKTLSETKSNKRK